MRKIKQICNNKRVLYAILGILGIIYFVRMLNLDQDLPPWGVGLYQPADEGAYCKLAIDIEKFGSIFPHYNNEAVNKYLDENSFFLRNNFFGNLISFFGFQVFGNNYIGMRIPYVILGFSNLSLILHILFSLNRGAKEKQKHLIPIVCIMGMLIFDFMFTMSTRVVETSAVRLLFTLLAYDLCININGKKNDKIKYFLMGIVITFSIFLVYVTNIFLYLACFLFFLILIKKNGWKEAIYSAWYFMLGCIIAFFLCELYYIFIWNTEAIRNMLNIIKEFQNQTGYQIAGVSSSFSITAIISNFLSFFSGNFFIYNLSVLAIFVLILPITAWDIVKNGIEGNGRIFSICIIFSFLLQTLVMNDYINRKIVIVYPLFIFILFEGYLRKEAYYELLHEIVYDQRKKIIFSVYSLLTIFFCIIIILIKIYGGNSAWIDFSRTDRLVLYGFSFLPVLIGCSYFIYKFLKKDLIFTKCLVMIFGCVLITNIYFDFKYFIYDVTYVERDSMINLSKIINDKYVVGSYQIGFTLYNDMRPVIATPDQIVKIMESDRDVLLIDYEDNSEGMRSYFDDYIFANSEYTAYPIWIIERNYQSFGHTRNMCVYKIKLKKEVIQEYRDNEVKCNNGNECYPDIKRNIYEDIEDDKYSNIMGNVYGNIRSDIYGDIYGNVYGNIYGNVYGDIYGNVYGKIYGNVKDIYNSSEELTEIPIVESEELIMKNKEFISTVRTNNGEISDDEWNSFKEKIYLVYDNSRFLDKYESNKLFINQLYKMILCRNASISECNSWILNLQEGMSREDVLEKFIESEELKRITGDELKKYME